MQLHCLQTVQLLEDISGQTCQPLVWSEYDDVLSVITKSGIYVISLCPVPSNLMPSLNTKIDFVNETQICSVGWMPQRQMVVLSRNEELSVQDPWTRKTLFKCKDKASTFKWWDKERVLFVATTKKSIQAYRNFKMFVDLKAPADVAEMLPYHSETLKTTVVFISLTNGLLKMATFKDDLIEWMTDCCWSQEDFLPATSMCVSDGKLLFIKGTVVVVCRLNANFQVEATNFVEIGHENVHSLEIVNNNHFIVGVESGPMQLMTVLPDAIELQQISGWACKGLQSSSNRYLWACLRDDDSSKGGKRSLSFFSTYSFADLSEELKLQANIKTDLIEAFRVQTLIQVVYDKSAVSSMIESVLEKVPDNQLKFMLSLFLATLTDEDRHKEGCEKVARTLLKSNKKTKDTKCVICNSQQWQRDYLDVAVCSNGHKWPVCSKTDQIIDTPTACRCAWCGSMAVYSFKNSDCTLCSGPLVGQI